MKYRGDISPAEYAAMEDGYEQGLEVARKHTDEEIEADRWDEGWNAAVIALCPHEDPKLRLLWVIEHMPKDNPYRAAEETR